MPVSAFAETIPKYETKIKLFLIYSAKTFYKKRDELPLSEFFLSLDSNQHPKQVIHLHGYYEEPKNIILSTHDYERAYGLKPDRGEEGNRVWSLHRKLLWAILATRRSVWLGFSMTDPYLKAMLNITETVCLGNY